MPRWRKRGGNEASWSSRTVEAIGRHAARMAGQQNSHRSPKTRTTNRASSTERGCIRQDQVAIKKRASRDFCSSHRRGLFLSNAGTRIAPFSVFVFERSPLKNKTRKGNCGPSHLYYKQAPPMGATEASFSKCAGCIFRTHTQISAQ